MKNEKTVVDIDYAEAIVPKSARRGIVTMFMIMLGFTFFSASMWVGQQLADGLDFQGFVVSMIVGGVILSLYTGLLGYVGAETGMSLDLLARKAFGVKGSYLPSAMISFTQIGWFGVGIAMFAIPVANELLGGSKTAEWALVIVAGICMTASAYFGIKSLTIIANRRGLTDAAAVGIVEKIIGFLFLIPSSMLSTVSALGAQNIGAGKPERARLTLRYAAMIACSFGIAVVILTLFIAEPLVGLFTPDAAVAAAGGQYLRGYIWDSFFAGVQFSFSGYFCACGKSGISFLHNSLSILLVRVPGAYLASKYFPQTLLPMGLANAAGSLFSILVCVIAYAILTRREKRAQEAT